MRRSLATAAGRGGPRPDLGAGNPERRSGEFLRRVWAGTACTPDFADRVRGQLRRPRRRLTRPARSAPGTAASRP
ncbi:hypothetical protein FSW04_19460 [Baekduia soli]|uniref:Uncharacterized protein n=1 Tax=Baekduia soli TaxID=496014 RepID=A0A5B8UA33_9ACTN|nr:hypothetical protein [Baekduia soli]QEC49532.1 hypothetical protein FSW04_19460 [Baekduia soli]